MPAHDKLHPAMETYVVAGLLLHRHHKIREGDARTSKHTPVPSTTQELLPESDITLNRISVSCPVASTVPAFANDTASGRLLQKGLCTCKRRLVIVHIVLEKSSKFEPCLFRENILYIFRLPSKCLTIPPASAWKTQPELNISYPSGLSPPNYTLTNTHNGYHSDAFLYALHDPRPLPHATIPPLRPNASRYLRNLGRPLPLQCSNRFLPLRLHLWLLR